VSGVRYVSTFQRVFALALFLLTFAASSASAATCDVTWDAGGDGTRWGDPVNWSGNALPSATENACLPNAAAGTAVVIDAETSVGSITASQPVSVNARLVLTKAATSTFSTLYHYGTIDGPGDVTVSGALSYGGTTGAGVDITATAPAAVSIQGGTINGGASLKVLGTTSWVGSLRIDGLVELGGTTTVDQGAATGPTGLLRVTGTLTRVGRRDSDSSFGVPLENLGTIASDGGSITFTGSDAPAPSTGTFGKAGATGSVWINGALSTGTGAKFNDGVFVGGRVIRTASLAINGAVELSGSSDGPGAIEVTGTLRWVSGAIYGSGLLHTAAAGTLRVDRPGGNTTTLTLDTKAQLDGTTYWTANEIRLYNSGITNTGTFHISAPDVSLDNGQQGVTRNAFTNTAAGTIIRDANADSGTTIRAGFVNQGTVRATIGRLYVDGGADAPSTGRFGGANDTGIVWLTGALRLGAGATLGRTRLDGFVDVQAAATVDGLAEQFGEVSGAGALTVNSRLVMYANSRTTGTGTTAVSSTGTLVLSTTGPCCGAAAIDRRITAAGLVDWDAGSFYMADGSSFDVTGEFRAEAPDSTIYRSGAGANEPFIHIAPTGKLTRTQGADSTTAVNINVDNDGSASAKFGVLFLDGGGADNPATGSFGAAGDAGRVDLRTGVFRTAAGASFAGSSYISGTLIANAPTPVTGDVQLFGRIAGSGRIDVSGTFGWYAGRMDDTGVTRILPAGKLTIGNVGYCCLVAPALARTLRNEGTAIINGDTMGLESGGVLENAGTLTLQNTNSINRNSGTGVSPSIVNTGTLVHRRDVGGQTVIRVPTVNDGTVRLERGDLQVDTYTQSAQATLVSVASGTAMGDETGLLSTSAARLGGTLTFETTGTYKPAIHDVLSPIRWGSRRGAFSAVDGFATGTTFAQNYRAGQLDIEVTAVPAAAFAGRSAAPDSRSVAPDAVEVVTPAIASTVELEVVKTKLVVTARKTARVTLRSITGRKLGKRDTVRLKGATSGVKLTDKGRTLVVPALAAGRVVHLRILVSRSTGATEYRVALRARR
jgi:hypothetical protein